MWIRLDTGCAYAGWVARLTAPQFAAWVKTLLIVKGFGTRGVIGREKFADHARHAGVDMTDVAAVATASSGKVIDDGTAITITDWNEYQEDRTGAQRQERHRENAKSPTTTGNPVTAVTPVTAPAVTPVSNGDVTGRNGTGRDVTERDGTEKQKRTTDSAATAKNRGPGKPHDVPPELAALELYAADARLCRAWAQTYRALRAAHPRVDVLAEVRKAHAWEVTRPAERKKNRPKFLASWVARAERDVPKERPQDLPPPLDASEVARMSAHAEAFHAAQALGLTPLECQRMAEEAEARVAVTTTAGAAPCQN